MKEAGDSRPELSPDKLKVAGFQSLGKEKLGDKETQVVGFTLDIPGIGLGKCKLWFDAKTNMPLKRYIEVKTDGGMTRVVESYTEWQIDPTLKGDEFTLPKSHTV